ncbi:MAG: hypothetical protein CMJ34_07680 [Phycisphaerae bacterium]|nr:hypothetical protein [Phycisphaerae bacterium]
MMNTMKISAASCALVALVAVTAVMAADGKRKGDRFVPTNDDFRASAQRAASQGSSPDCCPGDLNCDGLVDGADLGLMITAWGTNDPSADLTGNGLVDGGDLGLLIGAWGPCSG